MMDSKRGNRGMNSVILFKTPLKGDQDRDPYNITLLEGGYKPTFVQVLKEEYHLDSLTRILKAKSENSKSKRDWTGVVVTSRRGAEGWIKAVQSLDLGEEGDYTTDWSEIPLWTVGQASLDVFDNALKDGLIDRRYVPIGNDKRTAKSASTLIPLLLAGTQHNVESSPRAQGQSQIGTSGDPGGVHNVVEDGKPYLLVRGDKSLEEIPNALRESGKRYTEIMVYSTTPQDDLAHSIPDALKQASQITRPAQHLSSTHVSVSQQEETIAGINNETIWLAFFSPSSASYALDHLPEGLEGKMKGFAIGETTARYLESRGWEVHAIAEKPTAQGMLEAISASDMDMRHSDMLEG